MQLTTVTWNIGGGKLLKPGEDPSLMESYSVDAISRIAEWLRYENPDVIALQEAQGNDGYNQINHIASLIGYDYHFCDAFSPSHIDDGMMLCNGIISRYPISNHSFGTFKNPNISAMFKGLQMQSHDKGYGTCIVTVDGNPVRFTSTHLVPFHPLAIDLKSKTGKEVMRSVVKGLKTKDQYVIIQGDFNIDDETIRTFMPTLFKDGLEETTISTPTTPSDHRYDHVLYRGFDLVETSIDSSVQTDHYPIKSIFELKNEVKPAGSKPTSIKVKHK